MYIILHFYILRDQYDDGVGRNISLMKEQLAIIHRYTTSQQKEKTWHFINGPTLKNVMFLRKYEFFFFLNQHCDRRYVLSTNAGISVWRIVWVKTNCCWMSHMLLELIYIRFSHRLLINKGCVRQCTTTVCFPYGLVSYQHMATAVVISWAYSRR